MGYRIEGDGSINTNIWKDNTSVQYTCFKFRINADECVADVDGVVDNIDRMILNGVYVIISMGSFTNSNIIVGEEILRGVQSLTGKIEKDKHPIINIKCIMLPNIVYNEEPDTPPRDIDPGLRDVVT